MKLIRSALESSNSVLSNACRLVSASTWDRFYWIILYLLPMIRLENAHTRVVARFCLMKSILGKLLVWFHHPYLQILPLVLNKNVLITASWQRWKQTKKYKVWEKKTDKSKNRDLVNFWNQHLIQLYFERNVTCFMLESILAASSDLWAFRPSDAFRSASSFPFSDSSSSLSVFTAVSAGNSGSSSFFTGFFSSHPKQRITVKMCQPRLEKNDDGGQPIFRYKWKYDIFRNILFPQIFSMQNNILCLLTLLEPRNLYTQNEEIGDERSWNFEIPKMSKYAEFDSGSKIFLETKFGEKYHIFLTEK